MDISVIIPVSKDIRLLRCIDSIDVDAEIVVVFNNEPLKELIQKAQVDQRVEAIVLPDRGCNLAQVFNIGIKQAKFSKVLLANSDCIFVKHQIAKTKRLLTEFEVVKGSICFESNSLMTRLVAELRFLFHEIFSEKKALFGPGLAFHRSIIKQIGGYYFDEDMGWGEDGELSQRIYASDLKVYYLDEPLLAHPPESICHDLRIAYKIGYGEWIQHSKQGIGLNMAIATDLLNLFVDRKKRFRRALTHGGLALAGYLDRKSVV